MPQHFTARVAGRAALAALRSGPARVFAAFERSCYVETPAGIACLGGPDIGRGPLNALLEEFESLPVGTPMEIECSEAIMWHPSPPPALDDLPEMAVPASIRPQAAAFLAWLSGAGAPDDSLIGLGPGLTPAGDDFVGGAMIALRAFGQSALAGRVAAWALPLAKERTNRISRAHLQCAAAGEGHEALHDFLKTFGKEELDRLARVGHTSGLDAAAGALLALRLERDSRPNRD